MSYNPIVTPLFFILYPILLFPLPSWCPHRVNKDRKKTISATRDLGKQLAHSCPSSPSFVPLYKWNSWALRDLMVLKLVLNLRQQQAGGRQAGGRQNLDLGLPFNPTVLFSSLSCSPFMLRMAVYLNAYLWGFCGLRIRLEWLQVEIQLSLGGGNLEEDVGIHLGLAEFTRCS